MSAEVERVLAEVLREHMDMTDRSATDGCSCGYPDSRSYEAHVAAEQVKALAPLLEARERAEAELARLHSILRNASVNRGGPQ